MVRVGARMLHTPFRRMAIWYVYVPAANVPVAVSVVTDVPTVTGPTVVV
jgi:hypothetical protein